jgi:hypothetical protein
MKTTRFIQPAEFSLLCASLLVASPVVEAQFTLDGSRDAAYGAALTVQTVETQFGDNFSELNAGYAAIEGGNLHLLLTGQVENNFNRLNIFIDSVPGGQNVVLNDANNGGTNPENDNWAGKYANLTFESGFAADYLIIARNGNAGGDQFNLDFATMGGGLGAFEASVDVFGGSLTGVNAAVGASGIGVGYDNSNAAGVLGGSAAADQGEAAAVATGLELVIPLAALGNPGAGDTILITAHINGSNHDFLSNQSLAGYPPPQMNLGGDGAGGFTGTLSGIDLNNFAGNQYFSIAVPATSTLAEFQVEKDFTDDNPAEVQVTLLCNTGLPLEQTTMIAEGASVTFVVTNFAAGELDCSVTETALAGYATSYDDGSPAADECRFEGVTGGTEQGCVISNDPLAVDVAVTKQWFDEQLGDADPVASAYYECDGEMFGPAEGNLLFVGAEDTESFQVVPHWNGGTVCTVTEDVSESAVESDDSACESLGVIPGSGASCTITNTVFYEGIPTLNRYGIALMALLLLGMGIIGLRRFG